MTLSDTHRTKLNIDVDKENIADLTRGTNKKQVQSSNLQVEPRRALRTKSSNSLYLKRSSNVSIQRSSTNIHSNQFNKARKINPNRSTSLNFSNDPSKITSKLTRSHKNLADFFKQTKRNEHEILGIKQNVEEIGEEEEIVFSDLDDDSFSSSFNRENKIGGSDNGNKDNDSLMKKINVERDSPLYERTHKLNLFNTEKNRLEFNVSDEAEDYDDIEIVAQKDSTGINDDPEGYVKMDKEILNGVFGKMNAEGVIKAKKFKDPLELNLNLDDSKNELDLKFDDLNNDDEMYLEFPEEGEESENKKLLKLMEFYENK